MITIRPWRTHLSFRYVVAADLDGDGDIDLAVASFSDGRFVWYRNTDGAGSFASEGIDIDTMDSAQSIVAADVDLDGDLDLVVSSCSCRGGESSPPPSTVIAPTGNGSCLLNNVARPRCDE